MKLNEEEMYIAHLWLLTIPKVGIVVFSSLLFPKEFHIKLPQKTKVLAMTDESTCDDHRKYLHFFDYLDVLTLQWKLNSLKEVRE